MQDPYKSAIRNSQFGPIHNPNSAIGSTCDLRLATWDLFLHVEPEIDHIAILDSVIFAFQTQQAFFSPGCQRAGCHQVFVSDYFCADEASLNVGMNLPGGFLCRNPFADGPRAHFVFSNSEK